MKDVADSKTKENKEHRFDFKKRGKIFKLVDKCPYTSATQSIKPSPDRRNDCLRRRLSILFRLIFRFLDYLSVYEFMLSFDFVLDFVDFCLSVLFALLFLVLVCVIFENS